MKKYLAGLILLIQLMFLLPVSLAEENIDAVVANPVITDRLNLRKKPDDSSESLGRFYSGTLVAVLSFEGEWAKVRMNRLEGYMLKDYLYLEPDGRTAPCYFYLADLVGTVSLKSEPQNKGDEVAALSGTVHVLGDIGDDWRYVRQGQYFGYVKTNQLNNVKATIYTAYIQPQSGSSVADLYADRELKKRAGQIYAGAEVTVLDMSRAGWAKVQIKNGDDTYTEETFYLHSGDVNPFLSFWEIPAGRKTGVFLQDYTVKHDKKTITLPEGALCILTANFRDQDWLIEYGPEEAIVRVPQSIIGYQGGEVSLDGLRGNGYALILDIGSDARPAAAPDQQNRRKEFIYEMEKNAWGWRCLEYLGQVQGRDQIWYQVKNAYVQGYLEKERVMILENSNLYSDISGNIVLPGQHLFSEEDGGLYHLIAGAEETAYLVLKNEEWQIDQQFAVSDTCYTIYIPTGTRAVLEGGGKLQAVNKEEMKSVLGREKTQLAGTGRFFVPMEVEGNDRWDYRISPLDPEQESYYVISSLNTVTGKEIRVDLSDYDPDDWYDYMICSLQPGCFLEIHNCLVELYWGNG